MNMNQANGKLLHTTATVVPIVNADYLTYLTDLIRNAESSIELLMFAARYYQGKSGNKVNEFWQLLNRTAARGVLVRVLLNSNFYQGDSAQHNRFIAGHFKAPNFHAALSGKSTRLHSKLFIVDDRIVVVGSHNYSTRAFSSNFETSVVVYSPEVAAEFKSHFERLWKSRQLVEGRPSCING